MPRTATSTSSTRPSIPNAGGPTRPTGPQFGMRPAYVPTKKWSAGLQYEIPLGNFGSLTPRVDVSYQGDIFSNGANAATNRIESYTLSNARLTWRNDEGSWEGSLEVTNLTDEYYFLTRFDQFNADRRNGRPAGPPARVGLYREAEVLAASLKRD